jgi:hypothetical protein
MRRNEDILGLILAGGIGYVLGQESISEWKPIADSFKRRFQQLAFTRTPFPWASLRIIPNIQTIYRQSVYCYLFGLPDACLPTLLRVLEQSLISKCETVEGKKPADGFGLANLVDWAASFMKKDVNVAHSFRLMRNLVHTDTLIPEQDCIEAIRHVSTILEKLYPSQNIVISVVCHYCHTTGITGLLEGQNYLGNKITLQCNHCKKSYHWMVMP